MTQNEELWALAETTLFDLLSRKYVQRADARQKTMGLQYTEAETHDLAKVITRAITGPLLDANTATVAALRDLAVHAENMEAQNADHHGPEGVVRSAPLNAAYAALALAENLP